LQDSTLEQSRASGEGQAFRMVIAGQAWQNAAPIERRLIALFILRIILIKALSQESL
jgi:hypothetical protein